MACFKRLVSRLKTAVRRWRHSPKPRPEQAITQIPSPIEATRPALLSAPIPACPNIPKPATTTVSATVTATAVAGNVAIALPSLDNDRINRAQIQPPRRPLLHLLQGPPPLTRTSDSVLNAPIRTSIEEESFPCTPRRVQQQLALQPPKDEVRKQASNNPGGLSPGEWDRSARPSRCTSISSCVSTSRDSFRSKASTDGESLSAQLRRKRIDCHRDRRFVFIPQSDQDSLLTIPNFEKDIRDSNADHIIDQAEAQRIAQVAFHIAPKLFAILACLGRGPDIRFLLMMEISDKDLPFKKTILPSKKVSLQTKSGMVIEAFEGWDDEVMEDFHRKQWWMLAPVFEFQRHHELDDDVILPYIHFDGSPDMEQEKRGGYSEVYPACLHPSHHNFWPPSDDMADEPLLAIKRLYSDSEIEFDKERTVLTMLDSNGIHRHRITLLATFKYQGKYHLVFRYADANLKNYWRDRPMPNFDKATVRWCLRQMAGLADSLVSVHHLSVQCMFDADGKERLHKDTNFSIADPYKRFGRHGDIKAENILWYRLRPGNSSDSDEGDDMGTLQLADFGLSRVHRRNSRSNVPWDKISGSSAYEPPELKMHQNVSRAYDIWSLGCLYLEFITWLLEGFSAVTLFAEMRAGAATGTVSDDESFFSIVGGIPVVREEVRDWVAQLHMHEKCSALIHDLLNSIMRDMLCPKPVWRTGAKWVDHLLSMHVRAADENEDYLLKPVSWQQQIFQDSFMSSWSSALVGQGGTLAAKRMSVTFENEENGLPALENEPKFSNALRRNGGTIPRPITRASTFKV